MGRFLRVAAALVTASTLAPLAGAQSHTTREQAIPRDYLDSFVPLPERYDTPSNPASDEKIALGRILFFDPRLSRNHRLACTGCHDLGRFGDDGRRVSLGHVFPETELLLLGRYEEAEGDRPGAWRSTLYHARRLGRRWQGEAKLSHLRQGTDSEIHEAELGLKWAFQERGSSLLLAAGTDVEIPLRSGGDTTVVPYVSHAAPLGGRFTMQGTLRAHLPAGGVGEGDLELSEVVHWLPTEWPRGVFPGLEATVAAPFRSEGRWRASLIPQLHLALSKRGHVALNVAVELPLAGARADRRHRLHTFLLWDMADGGFWEGW